MSLAQFFLRAARFLGESSGSALVGEFGLSLAD